MTPAATDYSRSRAVAADSDAHYRLLGLAIITLFPAFFWTGLLALAGATLGAQPSALTLAAVGTSIAAFVFLTVSTLFAKIS